MSGFTQIDIDGYQARFSQAGQDHILIDVREADEYADGHLPGAILIPLSAIEANPQSAIADVSDDKPIVLVCARGGRSMIAAGYFADAGIQSEIINLTDGTLGWVLRGLPVEK